MAIIQQYHKDTDTTYVYESESYWVPELGQSRSKRRLIGKLDPETGEIIPCGKRGPKKKMPDGADEQVSASEYTKLRGQYEQSQTEATRLRLSLTEMEKELSDLRKQNQRMANTIQKIRGLIAE
jgi:hypothetical protein